MERIGAGVQTRRCQPVRLAQREPGYGQGRSRTIHLLELTHEVAGMRARPLGEGYDSGSATSRNVSLQGMQLSSLDGGPPFLVTSEAPWPRTLDASAAVTHSQC